MFFSVMNHNLNEFENLMDNFFGEQIFDRQNQHGIKFNYWQNREQLLFEAEVPGLGAEHIDISLKDNILTISGDRQRGKNELGKQIKFKRSFKLPFEVDMEKASASIKNGLLKLSLERTEADKPRKIEIKTI